MTTRWLVPLDPPPPRDDDLEYEPSREEQLEAYVSWIEYVRRVKQYPPTSPTKK